MILCVFGFCVQFKGIHHLPRHWRGESGFNRMEVSIKELARLFMVLTSAIARTFVCATPMVFHFSQIDQSRLPVGDGVGFCDTFPAHGQHHCQICNINWIAFVYMLTQKM